MRGWQLIPALAVAVAMPALAACGDDDGTDASGGDDGAITVVASFYPIAEAAERVGGDRVEVTNLTPAGVEPHDLELTPQQVDALEDADVVLHLGQGFQPAVAEIAERRDGTTIDVLDAVQLEAGAVEALEEEEQEEGGLDWHFWLDPLRFVEAVGEIEAALAEAAPEDADTFAANAQRYVDELTALDVEMEEGLSSCERQEIVTSHAAFHYLAERYGLTQVPIAGLSPEAEPDAGRIAELADQIEAEGITTVFYETLVAPDVAETLAREAGVETAVLNPIEGLSEEELDAGADYAAIMRGNLAAIEAALGCD